MVGKLADDSRACCFSIGTFLKPLAFGATLFMLAGCEGILGGIQDLGQGSGCSFVANILPVCGENASISPSEQVDPKSSGQESQQSLVKNLLAEDDLSS